jgi:hypothetical protein
MVWTYFKNKQRENSNLYFEHEIKRKCARGRWESRWDQQVTKDVTQKEGRTREAVEEELWDSRQVEWQGYQMSHIKWKIVMK